MCVPACMAAHSLSLTFAAVTVLRGKEGVLAEQCVCSQIGRNQVFLSSTEMKFPEHIKSGLGLCCGSPGPVARLQV